MNRRWVEQFYTECGRELTLAFNTLAQTNNWGMVLITGVLAAFSIGAIEIGNGEPDVVRLLYPNVAHWYYVIGAWVLCLRFFVRSYLPLTNVYRWNALSIAAIKVLSLPDQSPHLPVFERNLARKIQTYLHDWRSPQSKWFLIKGTMKLMYLWFFVILLGLFGWGLFTLRPDGAYFLGVGFFVIPTIVELYWFLSYEGFEYEDPGCEEEKEKICKIWLAQLTTSTIPKRDP